MYAIVDIETTGSHPKDNGITEIAIVLHNGTEIEGRFETLIQPGVPVPRYITYLTGITNEMLHTAPSFSEVADNIFNLLQQRVFIAHNVNFDYSFIKYHLRLSGYEWQPKKLCTLKLSHKAFPGLKKYGLGHLCRQLGIPMENRHRAGGDANATTLLFEKILVTGGAQLIKDFLKKENHEQILPPHLPHEHINKLPYAPGVYYFHDARDKVIYVGKAKALKKRVLSHFSGLNTTKKRQDFLRKIHSITFKECATEFMAALFESIEIKRLWPEYNISQKRFEQLYGIYQFEDNRGYIRLAIDKKNRYARPVAYYHVLTDAYNALWKLVKQFDLEPALCFLDKRKNIVIDWPDIFEYNIRVENALQQLQTQKTTFAIFESSTYGNEFACLLVEQGKFYGMGIIKDHIDFTDLDTLKEHITLYAENEMLRSMISSYAQKYPEKVYNFQV